MNRFVSLLLVALSLATLSLARPAQAQWVKGLPYFLNGSTQNSAPGTTVTATINNGATGHLNITATPTNYPYYSTSGNYSGGAGVFYVWQGGSLTKNMVLSATQSLESTGAGSGGGNSSAGGQQAYGDFSHSPGWDSKASVTVLTPFSSGTTPPSQEQRVSLTGTVSATYNSYSPGSTIVTADVTFGDPVTSYP